MNIRFEQRQDLKQKPSDMSNVVFGTIFTDYMLKMSYDEENKWHDMAIIPYGNISLDPSATVLHYSQTVFEGLKAYKTKKDEILLFRPEKNMKRLNLSCERLCVPKIDENMLLEGIKELLKIEKDWIPSKEDTSLYIRPIIFGNTAKLGVSPAINYELLVILSPVGPYYKTGMKPVSVLVEDKYVRAAKGGMGMTKSGGNYAVGLKSQVEAHDKGFEQTMWLDAKDRKYVEEFSAMNAFFVIDDVVVTPKINGSILEGVTRMSVIELLENQGYKVEQRKISIDEIIQAHKKNKLNEIFCTGTAAVIGSIGSLSYKGENYIINDRRIGNLTQKLYDELTAIQLGKIEDKNHWMVKVI